MTAINICSNFGSKWCSPPYLEIREHIAKTAACFAVLADIKHLMKQRFLVIAVAMSFQGNSETW